MWRVICNHYHVLQSCNPQPQQSGSDSFTLTCGSLEVFGSVTTMSDRGQSRKSEIRETHTDLKMKRVRKWQTQRMSSSVVRLCRSLLKKRHERALCPWRENKCVVIVIKKKSYNEKGRWKTYKLRESKPHKQLLRGITSEHQTTF